MARVGVRYTSGMSLSVGDEVKVMRPGSNGWTVTDLARPEIEAVWENAHYELVDGVVTEMAPAYFDGTSATFRLMQVVTTVAEARGYEVEAASECDLVLSEDRVVKPDGIVLTLDELRKSRELAAAGGAVVGARQRLYVPPSLVIESVSPGHERHDRQLKRRWYAEFGVGSYWLLDPLRRRLECLRLSGGEFVVEAAGDADAVVETSVFGGVRIELGRVWPRV